MYYSVLIKYNYKKKSVLNWLNGASAVKHHINRIPLWVSCVTGQLIFEKFLIDLQYMFAKT